MTKAVLGVIGGSGVYDLPGLEDVREEAVETPWGEPSDALRFGRIGGTAVVFLPRHGRGHRLSPSDINYRANIDALKRAGVTDIVSVSACGSFSEDLPPGLSCSSTSSSTAPTGARARSSGRAASPMCRWRIRSARACRQRLAAAAEAEGIAVPRGGTYVCMEGPQFSTLRRILTYRHLGCDVIGMTAMPEAKLAREAEISYATIAMVTDYDCWHPDHDDVDVAAVIAVMHGNADKAAPARGPARPRLPGRARALPGRLRPRARHRHHDGAVRARSRASGEARRRRRPRAQRAMSALGSTRDAGA